MRVGTSGRGGVIDDGARPRVSGRGKGNIDALECTTQHHSHPETDHCTAADHESEHLSVSVDAGLIDPLQHAVQRRGLFVPSLGKGEDRSAITNVEVH